MTLSNTPLSIWLGLWRTRNLIRSKPPSFTYSPRRQAPTMSRDGESSSASAVPSWAQPGETHQRFSGSHSIRALGQPPDAHALRVCTDTDVSNPSIHLIPEGTPAQLGGMYVRISVSVNARIMCVGEVGVSRQCFAAAIRLLAMRMICPG